MLRQLPPFPLRLTPLPAACCFSFAVGCSDSDSGGFWDNIGGAEEPVHCDAATPLDTAIEPASANPDDQRPHFSFFVTSQAGLYSLGPGEAAPAPNPAAGYGGDFGGLAGADEICKMLARASNPGDGKTWRAFLSTSGAFSDTQVDAIERIGPGPWYNYNGRELASSLQDLLPTLGGRPLNGDPRLREMFTDENGEDIRLGTEDNHDTLTGSDRCGRLYDDGEAGVVATCEDWTSSIRRGMDGNLAGIGGQIPVGHSWPRDAFFGDDAGGAGAHWISDHTINGCEAGYDIDGGFGAPAGDYRVGAGGGYGGIYCFALGAVAPE